MALPIEARTAFRSLAEEWADLAEGPAWGSRGRGGGRLAVGVRLESVEVEKTTAHPYMLGVPRPARRIPHIVRWRERLVRLAMLGS